MSVCGLERYDGYDIEISSVPYKPYCLYLTLHFALPGVQARDVGEGLGPHGDRKASGEGGGAGSEDSSAGEEDEGAGGRG